MGFRADREAQAAIVGAVLLLGIFTISISIYQTTVVPGENKEIEFMAYEEAISDVTELRNNLLKTASTGHETGTTVKVGARYPVRTLFVNPPPPNGQIRTQETENVTFTNLRALDSDVQNYLNGSTKMFSTREILFAPNYNELEVPGIGITTGSVVYLTGSGSRFPETEQSLIDGNHITVVTVSGDLDGQGFTSAVNTREVSSHSRTVAVESSGGAPRITIPTRLSASDWNDLLSGETRVANVSAAPGGVEITLTNGTYLLRLAEVNVRDDSDDTPVTRPNATYVVRKEGDLRGVANGTVAKLVVEVRDRYNNPVTGETVYFESVGTGTFTNGLSTTSALSGDEGQAEARYTPGVPGNHYVRARFDGSTDPLHETTFVSPSGLESPPIADANGPYTVDEGNSTSLDGSGSSDPDGTVTKYRWTVLDDPTGSASIIDANQSDPSATFNAPAVTENTEIEVSLTVTGSNGAIDSDIATVTVIDTDANQAPTASFTYSPSTPTPGQTITFDASNSTDLDGTITSYEWDWTNDGTYDATGVTATHSYGSTGTYTVKLRVTDDGGATDTTTRTVTVEAAPNQAPTAAFTYSPTSPSTGETITFDASNSSDPDGSITSYEWDWTDDGTYDATGVTATHSYGGAGTYTVRLRVTDNGSATDTTTDTVTVSSTTATTYLDCPATDTIGTTTSCANAQSAGDGGAVASLAEEDTQPGPNAKFALDVRMNFSGVSSGTNELQVRYRVTGDDEPIDLQVWDGGAWNTRGTLSSAVLTNVTYTLSGAEYNGGSPRIRFVDTDGNDGSQTTVEVDYARIVTN